MEWSFSRSRSKLRRFSGDPIVLGGCPRSGTTLLLSILSAHPQVAAIPVETRAFVHGVRRGRFDLPPRMKRLYRGLDACEVPAAATRWCEKTPENVLVFPKILDHFGDLVKILHIVRDGRDVVTSIRNTRGRHRVSPQQWVGHVSAGVALESDPRVLTLRYEDLVLDFDAQVSHVAAFLELDPEPLRSFPAGARVGSRRSWTESAGPVAPKSIGLWKEPRFAPVIASLLELPHAKELLQHFGYA